uniref:Uncharacterized protein n=1 Tax=Trichuris muris TaxID=70415 RepID=A0A5S6R4F2_TRIMR
MEACLRVIATPNALSGGYWMKAHATGTSQPDRLHPSEWFSGGALPRLVRRHGFVRPAISAFSAKLETHCSSYGSFA